MEFEKWTVGAIEASGTAGGSGCSAQGPVVARGGGGEVAVVAVPVPWPMKAWPVRAGRLV